MSDPPQPFRVRLGGAVRASGGALALVPLGLFSVLAVSQINWAYALGIFHDLPARLAAAAVIAGVATPFDVLGAQGALRRLLLGTPAPRHLARGACWAHVPLLGAWLYLVPTPASAAVPLLVLIGVVVMLAGVFRAALGATWAGVLHPAAPSSDEARRQQGWEAFQEAQAQVASRADNVRMLAAENQHRDALLLRNALIEDLEAVANLARQHGADVSAFTEAVRRNGLDAPITDELDDEAVLAAVDALKPLAAQVRAATWTPRDDRRRALRALAVLVAVLVVLVLATVAPLT